MQHQNQKNQNQLYWPRMLSHLRNLTSLKRYSQCTKRTTLIYNKKHNVNVTPSFFFLGSRFFEYIFLYQSLVMFQIDQKTKDCSKIALTEAWDPFDIPVQEWSDRKPARQHETWVGVYTLKDCYPVQETYVRNSSVTTSTRFFNLQLGISDPDVFTPPSTCQSARPERMSESGC
uniref:Mammalian ependymin-related protein 1 n=1 Tax=Labrus bergylta TaxID=56723 RepID=A0A3Q3FP61_9LABR